MSSFKIESNCQNTEPNTIFSIPFDSQRSAQFNGAESSSFFLGKMFSSAKNRSCGSQNFSASRLQIEIIKNALVRFFKNSSHQ